MKILKSILKLLLHTALITVIILLWVGVITLYP